MIKRIEKLLWPHTCPFCGKCSKKMVCDMCNKKLKELEIQEPYCMRCGKPVRYQEQEYCHDCRRKLDSVNEKTSFSYDRGVSLWLHKPPVNTSIYRFKYHNQRFYSEIYVACIVDRYRKTIRQWKPQALVPVPVHKKRLRERGYNQAEVLAYELGKRLGVPVIPNLVKRIRYTGFQKKLDPHQRKKNLEGAFAPGGVSEGWPSGLKRVIVVDDIYTTGNTIDQVSHVLKRMGVQKVYFLTVSIGQGY